MGTFTLDGTPSSPTGAFTLTLASEEGALSPLSTSGTFEEPTVMPSTGIIPPLGEEESRGVPCVKVTTKIKTCVTVDTHIKKISCTVFTNLGDDDNTDDGWHDDQEKAR